MSAAVDVGARTPMPFSAAPPLEAGPVSRSTIIRTLLAVILVGIVSAIPLPWMLVVFAAIAVLIGIMISPTVGLYLMLIAVGFSPTFGLSDDPEGGGVSLSAFEPLTLLMMLFWLLQGVTRHRITLPREGLFGSLILLLSILFLAAGGATSYPLAIKEILKWVLLILAYIYTRVTVRDDRSARRLLTVLFLTGAAEALLGAVQFFGTIGPGAFGVGDFIRAYGMFGQPNPYAGYLGTILPTALALSLVPQRGRFRLIAALSSLLIATGIVLSLSRGAWVGLVISLGVMAMAWGPRARKLVIPLAALGVLFIVLGNVGLLPASLASRVTSVTENFGVFDIRTVQLTSENFAIVERMAHWQAGWYMLQDYPFLGVGPGNYPAVYDQYYIPPWREPLGHAHNYYLNMAVEAGFPGMLALLLVLGMAFRGLKRRLVAANSLLAAPPETIEHGPIVLDPPFSPLFARALALGLLGSLAMFSIHNMFDNLLVHGVGIQVGVLLGLIGGVSDR